MGLSTIKDVSEFLQVKESTLYSWVSTKRIPFLKVNGLVRFDMEEIKGWLQKSKMIKKASEATARKSKGNQSIDMLIKRAIQSEK